MVSIHSECCHIGAYGLVQLSSIQDEEMEAQKREVT